MHGWDHVPLKPEGGPQRVPGGFLGDSILCLVPELSRLGCSGSGWEVVVTMAGVELDGL